MANTARRVGLEVGDSHLDKELRKEKEDELRALGMEPTGDDTFAERLEAVERRKSKDNKKQ